MSLKDISSYKVDNFSIYFIENIDGSSKIKELKLTDSGSIEGGWPKGFFDQTSDELREDG